MRRIIWVMIFAYCCLTLLSQDLRINEVMSSNSVTCEDFWGEYPDWVEFYNASDQAINLDGYGFTDDPGEPFKWEFPAVEIGPREYLLVFASGEDNGIWGGHWETIVDWGDTWKYTIFNSEPSEQWNGSNFDDSGWSEGPTGIGYGDGDDATIVPQTISVHLRKTFTLDSAENIWRAFLHVDYDDGFAAYLNGEPITITNLLNTNFNQPSHDEHEAVIYQGGLPNQYEVDTDLLQPGENVLAIQVHNCNGASGDLTMIPFLSILTPEPPPNPHGPADILSLMYPRIHTNFKISADGETLLLSTPDGTVIDEVDLGCIPPDVSFGRQPDGGDAWFFFDEPTPEAANTTQGYQGVTVDPEFSLPGGVYNGTQQVELSVDSPSALIYYTLDGSEPADSHEAYSGPIDVTETTVIRAKAFENGCLPSSTKTESYLLDVQHNLPIVSISTNPEHFFDWHTGIYVMGPNASQEEPYFGANFWQDWERPINIELFEPDGEMVFNVQAGVKIFGNYSRMYAQKSLAIYARGCYGFSEIEYPIFPGKPIDTFESFILRNSGNDWSRTMMRDGMMTGLVEDLDIELQAYRPSVLYLNGEYWGIHNIREKINEHFLESNCGVDADRIDILEGNAYVNEGSSDHYLAMIDYIETHVMSNSDNYAYVQTQMDVQNFITYEIAEIYFNNTDWPGGNIKYWRPQRPDGKWRWILYDTDFGFGLHENIGEEWMNNTLEWATDPNSGEGANPPWSTFLLRSLLDNDSFRRDFINRFCDLLNTNFRPECVIPQIQAKAAAIESEIFTHIARWDNVIEFWRNRINTLITFANRRSDCVKEHLRDYFNLGEMHELSLDVASQGTGTIRVNTVEIDSYPWQGKYFGDIPITLTAIPAPGYQFAGWQGDAGIEPQITLSLLENDEFVAMFEEAEPEPGLVCINEINYNSSDDFNPEDWVELYNAGQTAIDLSSWQFKDEDDDHVFTIDNGTILGAGGFLVIFSDADRFESCFPGVSNCIGEMDFGLSGGGELIRLFDADGNLVDSVEYDDGGDWPSEPDGDGPTLELVDALYDNSLPASWAASIGHGTPGEQNSTGNDEPEDAPPMEYSIRNYPNPFNPSTTFAFSLPASCMVEITVYNPRGQKVVTVVHEKLDAGTHEIVWNGEDSSGKSVATGVYFYRMCAAGKKVAMRKCLLMK